MKGAAPQEFSPGLAGVPDAKSSVSFVAGQTSLLEYWGIRIEELAQHSSFPETTYLLLYNELPAQTELDRFTAEMTQHRRITYQIRDQIKCLPEHGHRMDALQATVAALGMFYPARHMVDRQVQYWSTIRLIAKVPTIVAAYYRLRRGDESIHFCDDLDHASNFPYVLTETMLDPLVTKVLDTCLILHADHMMNALPWSIPTRSSPWRAGPWKGRSKTERPKRPSRCWKRSDRWRMFGPLSKETRREAEAHGVRSSHLQGQDPRALMLQQLAPQLVVPHGRAPLYTLAETVECVGEGLLDGKGIHANGISMQACSTKRWASIKTSSRPFSRWRG